MQFESRDRFASGARLIKLALALYRKEVTSVVDAEQAESMQLLLRLANGDSELMAWATALTGADENELHHSCIAFIEHVFFTVATNHYGVLGLNPWATANDVKEHYRLLIRLFHPDRGLVKAEHAESYAAMINQAYTALKQPVAESAAGMSKAAKSQIKTNIRPVGNARAMHAAAGLGAVRLLPWLSPGGMLVLTALLIVTLVVLIELPQPRHGLSTFDVLSGKTYSGTLADRALAVEAMAVENSAMNKHQYGSADSDAVAVNAARQSEDSASSALRQQQTATATPATAVALSASVAPSVNAATAIKLTPKLITQPTVKASQLSVKSTQPPVKATQSSAKPLHTQESTVPLQMNVANNNPTLDTSPRAVAASADAASEQVTEIKRSASAETQATSVALVASKQKADVASERELRDLLTQFLISYERGDIRAFMQLFATDVETDEAGGRTGLQKTYARFFNTTQSRSMILKDLHWKREDGVMVAEADYRANTVLLDKTQEYKSKGSLRFEVQKSDQELNIVSFYHVVHQ